MDIKSEIKSNIIGSGWTMTEVVNEINRRRKLENKKKLSLSNLSNKINRQTIKYSEIKEIASVINCNLEWRSK